MKIVLFDTEAKRKAFLPLTYTRSIADMRFGMMTIAEKWQAFGFETAIYTADYLSYPAISAGNPYLFIDASLCPTADLTLRIQQLSEKESLKIGGEAMVFHGILEDLLSESYLLFKSNPIEDTEVLKLDRISDIFEKNDIAIRLDYEKKTHNRTSAKLNKSCSLIGTSLYLHETAKATSAIFNTESGPIYIDEGAEVMEGALLRGPLYVGKNAVVKMGAKIYGATTIGPYCKVGGEISNSILMGYSNKGHDGFLGNSILGEWCNLGADTNTSNLKNNYGSVKTWSYTKEQLEDTGLTFHGLIMGDHSKAGINTMFNTGTTVGVCANIFGGNFPEKFIPSYSWGGADGMVEHQLDKAIATATIVCLRRKIELDERNHRILQHVFRQTQKYRT